MDRMAEMDWMDKMDVTPMNKKLISIIKTVKNFKKKDQICIALGIYVHLIRLMLSLILVEGKMGKKEEMQVKVVWEDFKG